MTPGRTEPEPSTDPVAGGPVYVAGLDRSGKTTMAGFLASHPNVCIPGVGSNMWTYFYRQYGDLARRDDFERCLTDMLRYKHVLYLEPDPARIRREFAAGPPTYARLFALFLRHYAERRGKPRWGAQTGLIERYAEQLFAAYPGLRVIHMIRDPRDRYEASLSLWPDGKGRAGGAAARWRYSTTLARRHARAHPDAYLIIRFEDLVAETEPTLRRVCAFIGEDYTPAMLELEGAPQLRARLNGSGSAARTSPLSTEHIGAFRGRVPAGELAFIQLHTRALMRAHGYEPETGLLDAAGWSRFALIDWPDQLARMTAWRGLEELQQRFPERVRRTPGRRMIVDAPVDAGVEVPS
jgi:hypothetical protein